MKLTHKNFVDGFELGSVTMADLKDYVVKNGIASEKVFIQGRGKAKCINLLVDWVEQSIDKGTITVDDSPLYQAEPNEKEAVIQEEKLDMGFDQIKKDAPVEIEDDQEEVASAPEVAKPIPEITAPVVEGQPSATKGPMTSAVAEHKDAPMSKPEEVPLDDRRSSGRNERPVPTSVKGAKDSGSNWVNRRLRVIALKKGKAATMLDASNDVAKKTSYIARRLRKFRGKGVR